MKSDERGLVLLFWVFAFPGLLAFLVLVADSGLTFTERRGLQNTADAAALAGAITLHLGTASAAEADAEQLAALNTDDLTFNNAVASAVTGRVTVTVRANADSLLDPNSVLSFGASEITATATARTGTYAQPGPGVFCVGAYYGEIEAAELNAETYLAATPGVSWMAQIAEANLDGNNFYTVLRAGSQTMSASNTGYVGVGGINGANAIRDCFENGSEDGLSPTEPTKPGVATSTGQGLQARLEAAKTRGCYSWGQVMASLAAANPNGDSTIDTAWECSPHGDPGTSIVLVPVIKTDFLNLNGKTTVDVYSNGAGEYMLAYFWLDGERTFQDTDANNWKFIGPQGQADVEGVFLAPHYTELSYNNDDGSGGIVECTIGESTSCFAQLVD